MPPKNLFADSSSEDEVEVAPLKVNTAYADKYEAVKRKQELQRLSNKYANVSSSSDDTDEDDEAVLVTDDHELEFADLLKKLRTNDPSLKDTSVKFFANTASAPAAAAAAAKGERFTLKQEFQRTVVKAAEGALPDNTIDENDRVRRGLKRVTNAQEKAARDAFLKAAEEAENDAAEFTVKAAPTSKATERSGKAAEKVKTAFAAGEVVDENDQFLMNFFGSEVWRQTNKNVDYTWDQEAADEQDEIFYDDAEVWEREFQDQKYRHEEGIEATQIQTFARQQEGLLRAKDTRRKDARERKEERQHETELRATEELKRLKALKREEIAAFQKKIAEIAGLNSKSSSKKQNDKGKAPRKPSAEDEEEDARVAALISQAALEEDFDPETFDQQMNALFNDQYYDAIDDDEMAALEAEDTDFIPSGDDDDDDADEAVEDPKPKPSKTKTTRQALKEADVPEVLQDEADFLYPTQSISAAVSRQTHRGANQGGLTADELESQLEKKMDEYWRLHYHSVAGGVRTRFKYREVNAEKFGLDDEEILMLDDRTLNMIAPFNSYASYLNKQQNTKDRYKALHRRKNMRTLNPERRSRRYRTNTVALDPEAVSEQEGIEIAKAARRLNVGTADDVEEVLKKVEEDDAVRNASLMEKQVAKREERGGRERPTRPHEGEPARKAHFSEARQQHTQQHTRGPRPQQHGDRPPHLQSNRGQHHQRQAAPRKPE